METLKLGYQDFREFAKELNRRRMLGHPCSRGKGECCRDTQIPLLAEDRSTIQAGISSGKISPQTVENAKLNARLVKKGERDMCPFFDTDKRECTIYDSRPLTCMIAGVTANTRNEKGVVDARLIRQPIPIKYTDMVLCSSCAQTLNESGYQVPIEYFRFDQLVGQYMAENVDFSKDITSFALKLK